MSKQELVSNNSIKARWEEMFNRLCKFKEANGHCLVPNRYKPDPQLGFWVSTQRRQYRKTRIHGPNSHQALSPTKESRLEAIGFQWSARDPRCQRWDKCYQQLKDYVAANGHAQVPIKWKANIQLSNWVSRQRQEYRRLQNGFPSQLTKNRLKLLEAVGFVWEPKRGAPRKDEKVKRHNLAPGTPAAARKSSGMDPDGGQFDDPDSDDDDEEEQGFVEDEEDNDGEMEDEEEEDVAPQESRNEVPTLTTQRAASLPRPDGGLVAGRPTHTDQALKAALLNRYQNATNPMFSAGVDRQALIPHFMTQSQHHTTSLLGQPASSSVLLHDLLARRALLAAQQQPHGLLLSQLQPLPPTARPDLLASLQALQSGQLSSAAGIRADVNFKNYMAAAARARSSEGNDINGNGRGRDPAGVRFRSGQSPPSGLGGAPSLRENS